MAKEQPPIHGGVEKMGGAGCVTGVRHSADDCRSVQGSFESGECAKRQAVEGLDKVFSSAAPNRGRENEATIRDLPSKIGELTMERAVFLCGLAC